MNAFKELGQISWLWMNSKLHADWSTRLMTRNVIPPISLEQYKIILNGEGLPLAYASWAFFSKEAEFRYIANPSQIQLEDWNSGDRMWFIDYISPFSIRHTLQLKSLLRDSFHDRFARALRVTPEGKTGKVLTYFGENAPDGWRNTADTQIMSHFTERENVPHAFNK
jgi:cytolysin-activating lysine-acyltransferase